MRSVKLVLDKKETRNDVLWRMGRNMLKLPVAWLEERVLAGLRQLFSGRPQRTRHTNRVHVPHRQPPPATLPQRPRTNRLYPHVVWQSMSGRCEGLRANNNDC